MRTSTEGLCCVCGCMPSPTLVGLWAASADRSPEAVWPPGPSVPGPLPPPPRPCLRPMLGLLGGAALWLLLAAPGPHVPQSLATQSAGAVARTAAQSRAPVPHADSDPGKAMRAIREGAPVADRRPPYRISGQRHRPPVFGAPFKALLDISPLSLVAVIAAVLAVTACLFTGVYMCLPGPLAGGDGRARDGWLDMFLFSLSVTTTLGRSPAAPQGTAALLAANLHALLVQVLLVFVTGVVFTRLSRPAMTMSIATRAILGAHGEEVPTLTTRFFFDKVTDSLMDVRFQLTFFHMHTPTFHKTMDLHLVRSETPILRIGTQVPTAACVTPRLLFTPPPPTHPLALIKSGTRSGSCGLLKESTAVVIFKNSRI